MSDSAEFSIFGGKFDKKPEKLSQDSEVSGQPDLLAPPAFPIPGAPEVTDIEHLSAEQLDALFPSENAEKPLAQSHSPPPSPEPPETTATVPPIHRNGIPENAAKPSAAAGPAPP